MDVTIAVTGEHSADELRALRAWLADDEDLAGLVVPVAPTPCTDAADRDSRSADASPPLVVTLTERADGAALAHALVAWILDHAHDFGYEVARPDGLSVRLRARRVRETGGAMVRELMAELCRSLDHDTSESQPAPVAGSGEVDERLRAAGE